jgi:hypothetical protein
VNLEQLLKINKTVKACGMHFRGNLWRGEGTMNVIQKKKNLYEERKMIFCVL